MGYELGEDDVRVTVRVPRALYTAYTAKVREFHAVGIPSLSAAIRLALTHWLECLKQHETEAGARRVMGERATAAAKERRRRVREARAARAASQSHETLLNIQ